MTPGVTKSSQGDVSCGALDQYKRAIWSQQRYPPRVAWAELLGRFKLVSCTFRENILSPFSRSVIPVVFASLSNDRLCVFQ